MSDQPTAKPLTPLLMEAVTPRSRELAELFLERWPTLNEQMFMEDDTSGLHLLVKIPSPTGDEARIIVVWMEDEDCPSVGFGPWHTHGDVWALSNGFDDELEAIVDIVGAIMNDQLVIVRDVDSWQEGSEGVLDLRKRCALEEEMTSRYSPGRVRILSFTGAFDRELGFDDLNQ